MTEKDPSFNHTVFSLSVGSNDWYTNAWEEEALSFNQDLVGLTFPGARTSLLLGKSATIDGIRHTIDRYSRMSSEQDTLFFFYSGHGLPESLSFPGEKMTTEYPKQELFADLALFPGRKIVILSCCHGGYPEISDNTLLVTPSKQETPAYASAFYIHLLFEFYNARSAPQALPYLIQTFLTTYHNRPYGPLDNKIWEQDPTHTDLAIYEEEKKLGRVLLNNYQRAFVLSTLMENGVMLVVDPSCFFV